MTRARDREAGISLVEILVVLAIFGAVAGAAVLALDRADAVLVETEARRLADRLQLAADEALVTGTPLALAWEPDSYRFLAWAPEAAEWRPAKPPPIARPHPLPRGLELAREGSSDRPLVILPDAAAPAEFRVGDGSLRWRVRFDGVSTAAEPAGG